MLYVLVPFPLTETPEGFIPDDIRDAEDMEVKRAWLHDKAALVVGPFVNISDTASAVTTAVMAEEQQHEVFIHLYNSI